MEMSITRGLAELKLLDKRIEKAIHSTNYAGACVGKKPITPYTSNEQFENEVRSAYQSVQDLINRRQTIKSAIVDSNAKTVVKIGETEMTVAEAIERKSSIEYDKTLLGKLKSDYNNTLVQIERHNENVNNKLDKHLETIFGKDGKDKTGEMESVSKAFKAENEAKLVDPLKIKEVIDKLEYEIDEFENECDFVLSESNTITKITIEN
jgi:hypothetical protein